MDSRVKVKNNSNNMTELMYVPNRNRWNFFSNTGFEYMTSQLSPQDANTKKMVDAASKVMVAFQTHAGYTFLNWQYTSYVPKPEKVEADTVDQLMAAWRVLIKNEEF